MDLGLAGRVAMVTGATRGIGRATAIRLAEEGARVALTFRHNRAAAEATAAAISERGGEALVTYLDLGDPSTIITATEEVLSRWQRIDVLVNNAVEWITKPEQHSRFERVPPVEWQHLVRTNFEGVYALTQALVPGMREGQWGRIIFVSSVAATDGMAGYAWYGAAKAALHGLTRTLAQELGPAGILANVVIPGGTATETILEHYPRALIEQQSRKLPIRRLPRPDEVAAVIVFLASATNTTITGEFIRASGGRP